ncbi:MAG: peptidoglycan-binding protein [Desulfomonile sp.]|nr:peptidoglycan-binding protein [Desulfomonile sp.]
MTVYLRGYGGPEVERIQLKLKELGFYGGHIDGAFGGGTESAVRAFQRARSLAADGRVSADKRHPRSFRSPYPSPGHI